MHKKRKCALFLKKNFDFLQFRVSHGISLLTSGYCESIPKMLWPWCNEDWFSPSQQDMAKISLFGCENSSLISSETSEDV